MRSVIDNRRWKAAGLWYYVEADEPTHTYGFWVTKGENSWRFWCLTPSAAYWLAANLNEHLVGNEITHQTRRRKRSNPNDEWHPMKVMS